MTISFYSKIFEFQMLEFYICTGSSNIKEIVTVDIKKITFFTSVSFLWQSEDRSFAAYPLHNPLFHGLEGHFHY
ncbi:hypothetical protein L6452_31342 [Arctium lappa]|uniref:Uncharacterized protein n=1 Tax=Arctium lappa TaxID=4217 RepID=A0ACB8ZLN2_ARCLA|nr:hypothetical protein L6452_31342 [Arctium lappa]